MRIIFISNAITPHQIPLCDELASMYHTDFIFIESINLNKDTLPVGWRVSCDREYVISYGQLTANLQEYIKKILSADAVIFGSGDFSLIKQRLAANKLTFIYSERIYRNWRERVKYPFHLFKFNIMYRHSKELFLLCAGAFSAKDYNSLGLFRDKAFKWGYFTRIESPIETSQRNDTSIKNGKVYILWCARFILLKHPELAVKLAKKLKNNGYEFQLDMIGTGDQFDYIKQMIDEYGLSDVVNLLGSQSNDEVYRQMKSHDIFLFTSDQNEGWGAVSNESMSNGCVLVASDKIGSTPYLIKNGENGMIFKSESIDSLYEKVKYLLDNPDKRNEMSRIGIDTIVNLWSPKNAAQSLSTLINDLLNHRRPSIPEGPCSKA